MKNLKLLFALLVLGLTFAGTASAQNGVFAPYVAGRVSSTANLGYKDPNYGVTAGIESSSKSLLLDVNGTFDSANPIRVLTTTGALVAGDGYTTGLHASGYIKLFSRILIGGGANWEVNPATVKATINNKIALLNAARSTAMPFVGGGFNAKRDRFLVNYNLPGKDELAGERKIDFHNEVLFLKGHVRLVQDVAINSFINSSTSNGLAVPGTNVRVTGNSVGGGIKLVL